MLLITLELEEEPRDIPGLGYALAHAKHDGVPITLTVGGFGYDAKLQRVQLERTTL